MADLMWGGVPFRVPSKTAMKYMGGHRAVPDLKVNTIVLDFFLTDQINNMTMTVAPSY